MKTKVSAIEKNDLFEPSSRVGEDWNPVITIPLPTRFTPFLDDPKPIEKKSSKLTMNCLTPAKWVKGAVLATMTGYSIDAQKHKRVQGIWIEGVHWREAPDGKMVYNLAAIERWCEGK